MPLFLAFTTPKLQSKVKTYTSMIETLLNTIQFLRGLSLMVQRRLQAGNNSSILLTQNY
jgi:hypothetical protein